MGGKRAKGSIPFHGERASRRVLAIASALADSWSLIHTFHGDRTVRMRECSEQTVLPDAELVLIRANQASDVMVGILSRALESFDHTTSHLMIELL